MLDEREHLLVILAEEAAEIQKVVAKILRFGDRTQFGSNEEKLQEEFNDLLAIADMLFAKYYDLCRDEDLIDAKIAKVQHYMEESKMIGTLEGEYDPEEHY